MLCSADSAVAMQLRRQWRLGGEGPAFPCAWRPACPRMHVHAVSATPPVRDFFFFPLASGHCRGIGQVMAMALRAWGSFSLSTVMSALVQCRISQHSAPKYLRMERKAVLFTELRKGKWATLCIIFHQGAKEATSYLTCLAKNTPTFSFLSCAGIH